LQDLKCKQSNEKGSFVTNLGKFGQNQPLVGQEDNSVINEQNKSSNQTWLWMVDQCRYFFNG